MKYMQFAALLASSGFVVLTTGCATVTGGTTQSVSVKTQKNSADVVGATCVLTNSEGKYQTVTPGKVSVHRAKDDLSIQCTKDGESSQAMKVESKYRKGALAGDIFNAGVVGLVMYGVDRANGSVFAYPDDITVSFGTSTTPQPGPDAASVPLAASTPLVTTDSTASANASPAQAN